MDKVMIGQGKVVHFGMKIGARWVALCGARANGGGRRGGLRNVNAFCYPVEEEAVVTCIKCLAKRRMI